MTQLRIVIADDEPLARAKLQRLVADHDQLDEVGIARTGPEAIEAIDRLKPDVIFLDIRMPGATGLEVVEKITHKPRIVFTTAYDEFAVTAFELQAIDYLLKPFGKKRFTQTIDRILELGAPDVTRVRDGFVEGHLKQLFVQERGRLKTIPVSSILRISGARDYAEVTSQHGKHLLSVRMKNLIERLDPTLFIRIHRSTIVNMSFVEEIVSCGNGRYDVTMSDGLVCSASRSGAALLRQATRNE